MAGFTVDTSGLMACQRAIASEVSEFSGLANTLRQNQVPASEFGSLPSSAQLAQLTAKVNDAARSQLGAARAFLQGADDALVQTLENYMGVEQFTVASAADAMHTSAQSIIDALRG
jgi:hypothetical protein